MRLFPSILVVILPCLLTAQSFLSGGLSRFAGIDTSTLTGDNGPAYYAAFQGPYAVARDRAGNIYIGEEARIRKIDTHGVVTTIAGTGTPGYSGDGGPATAAELSFVGGIAFNSQGILYFSDDQDRIRSISLDGTISLVVMDSAQGLAVDAEDRLYVANPNNAMILVIGTDGTFSTFAGTGTPGYGGEGGPAIQAQLSRPSDLAFDAAGNLYIADGQRVAKIDTHGVLTRIAGDPSLPLGTPSQDGVPATQSSLNAFSVATDPQGDVFVATPRVRKITPDGIIHAFAGVETSNQQNFSEACGDALKASVSAAGMTADASGDVFFIDRLSGRLEEATPAGKISTIAGAGPNLFTGDGGPAISATFANPHALAFDKQGNLYVADTNNNRIRKIDASGIVSTVIGDGGPVYNQDPLCLPDQDKFLRNPQGVAVDAAGDIFVADTGKNRVLQVAPDGTQTTIGSQFSAPQGVLAGAMNLFVTDSGNSALKNIDAGGAVHTLWTKGAVGSMAFDAAGDLFFSATNSVERLSVEGAISPVAGTGEYNTSAAPGFGSGPEELGQASAVALDSAGSIYVADEAKSAIYRVSHNCALSVEYVGATLRQPAGLTFDAKGDLYMADALQGTLWIGTPTPAPANEKPTPIFGRTGIQSAAPANLVYEQFGEPPTPPTAPSIAPGALLRIRGVCMGPFDPVFVGFGGSGALSTSAGGTQILFNNTPAPLISVSSGEIIAQAPFELDSSSGAEIALTYHGVTAPSGIGVQAANPALFTMSNQPSGPVIALNQDGTINSAANPAPKGSIVVMYATGTGQTIPPGSDGTEPPDSKLPKPKLPVLVTIGSQNAQIFYAGDAPGFVGLTQLNVGVPASLIGGGEQPITLQVGSFPLNQSGVTIFVAP